jgi:hypothetical protein
MCLSFVLFYSLAVIELRKEVLRFDSGGKRREAAERRIVSFHYT